MLRRRTTANIWCLLAYFLLCFCVDKSIQNQAPYFHPQLDSTYFFPESNQTKIGDVLLHLSANDADDDEVEFGINGEFYNKLLEVKRVDGKNANVILKQPFDREVQEKYENIVFFVRDPPGNQILQAVRFVIIDIDDNAPVFIGIPYRVDVHEKTSLDEVIFNAVSAYDLDGPLYNEFKFEILESGALETYFSIETLFLSSGHYNGSVRLVKELDYEKQKVHLLTINANGVNSHTTSSTDLIVNVIDSPDMPPEFSQSPYYFKIAEEMPIDVTVFQITAKDGDSGINNQIAYEINYQTSPAAQYFSIDEYTGELKIRKRLDRESSDINQLGDLLEFTVIAYEIGDESSRSEVQVTVAIMDINDNEPTFDEDTYNLSITPKTNNGASLTILNAESINIHDLDKGLNGSFTLSLHRIVGKSLTGEYLYEDDYDFEIVPSRALNYANVNVRVKDARSVNMKSGELLHYSLRAHDNGVDGKVKKAELFISIEKINAHAPKFDKDLYVFFLNENSQPNTTVDYMTAVDGDVNSDVYGKVYYELKNGQNRFEINNETGRIYTISRNPTIDLDRETIDTFYLSVDAIDGGGLRTSAKVIIKLNDLNDNTPEFVFSNSNSFFTGLIEENSVKWLESVKLQSVDQDIGLNAAVSYTIVDGDCVEKFTIDKKSNKLTLKENQTFDFEQLYELKRTNMLFDVDLGKIAVAGGELQALNNNDEIHLHLVVMVRDFGTPSLSTKTIVKIIVKDVNDNSPKFEKHIYYAKVSETATSGNVAAVKATDLDAVDTPNSKINYRIANGAREKFIIDSNTGVIQVMPNAQLDRNLYGANYTLEIVANDFGANLALYSNSTMMSQDTCFVVIEIVDVNNKKPEFLNEINLISIFEDIDVNKTFISLKASDLDANANLRYFVLNSNPANRSYTFEAFDEYNRPVNASLVKNWFGINSKTGDLYIKSPIDRETAELVKLVVYVEDKNADKNFKPQISSAMVNIKILDVNDNYPVMYDAKLLGYKGANDGPVYELYTEIAENSKYGTKIVDLKATDFDVDRNITFTIPKQSKSTVFVNDLIDYEKFKWINMTIYVYDNGKPEQKYSTLLLYCKIIDLNDNMPVIDKIVAANNEYSIQAPVYGNATLRIKNTLAIGSEIAEIHAIDKDDGLNSEIFFYFDETRTRDSKFFLINAQTGKFYLNSKLNRENQTVFNLDLVASDRGSPQLKTRLIIRMVVTDEYNNAAVFHKKQICLSNLVTCDSSDYQTITVRKLEEQNDTFIGVFNYAKMIDSKKKDRDICYYLLGADRDFFKLNSSSAALRSKINFDREKRSKYELILQASEKCDCSLTRGDQCDFTKSDTYDSSSLSRMRIRVLIDDINDNRPYFSKTDYIAALTPDKNYGDVILEGETYDLDISSEMSVKIVESSLQRLLTSNRTILKPLKKSSKFPFKLEYDDETKRVYSQLACDNEISSTRFRLKLHSILKDEILNTDLIDDIVYYEFKIGVADQKPYAETTSTVRIYIVNKSQRLKLTFSHSIEFIKENIESLRSNLANVTGFRVNIDSIQNHPYLIANMNETTDEHKTPLTDVFMHFINDTTDNTTTTPLGFNILPADVVISTIDRSKDLVLIRKYRLVLAEQFTSDKENIFTFNSDQYPFSISASSITSNTQVAQFLLIRMLLIILCLILAVLVVFILILCYMMRRRYKHKLKSERAIIKTFDLSLITTKYNASNNNINHVEGFTGYSNKAFNSTVDETTNGAGGGGGGGNLLTPYIPGTNLYSYEGSNPIWLKKYDKIETISSSIRTNTSASESESAASTASSYSKQIDTYKLNNKHRVASSEKKTFYLNQNETSSSSNPPPASTIKTKLLNNAEDNLNDSESPKKEATKTINFDQTFTSVTSNESNTANNICILNNTTTTTAKTTSDQDTDDQEFDSKSGDLPAAPELNDLSSFNIQTAEKLRNCLLSRVDSLKYNKNKQRENKQQQQQQMSNNSSVDLIQLQETTIPISSDTRKPITSSNFSLKQSSNNDSQTLENTLI